MADLQASLIFALLDKDWDLITQIHVPINNAPEVLETLELYSAENWQALFAQLYEAGEDWILRSDEISAIEFVGIEIGGTVEGQQLQTGIFDRLTADIQVNPTPNEEFNPAKVNYHIESSGNQSVVELWSSQRLPFEPKGWLKEMREELRSALGSMESRPGAVLKATYVSLDSAFFDLENVLLYNIGSSAVTHLCSNGLILERLCAKPPCCDGGLKFQPLHYHRYELVPNIPSIIPQDEDILAEWCDVPCHPLHTDTKPHVIWAQMMNNPVTVHLDDYVQKPFGIDLILAVPSDASVNLAGILKPLVDGIVSAFHSHDGSTMGTLAERISILTNEPSAIVEEMLLSDGRAILGERRLLFARENGVQWNPADDLAHRIRINIRHQPLPSWLVSGKIYRLAD